MMRIEYYYDPFLGPLIKRVIRMVDESYTKPCDYEYAESTYGAGDAYLCGRDAVENNRCLIHLDA